MEYLQLFDENRNIVDEKIERKSNHVYTLPSNRFYMVVLIFIQNDKGEFLMQKTSKSRSSVIATTGGHVTYGDTSLETVVKECEEELGLSINVNNIEHVCSDIYNDCILDTYYTKMNIDTAYSGAGAMALAEINRYDLILMDQRMPGMDGTETLHQIRKTGNCASKDSPVICLTADAVVGAKERYLSEGFTDFLTKPIDSYALEKMIIKYLPENKVERISEDPEMQPDSNTDISASEAFDGIREAGIDPRVGLTYCQNDNSFYISMLAEFSYGKREKEELLIKSFETSDWNTYAIHTHSLKSTAKMIGALELSELAAQLEAAANAGNEADIKRAHSDLIGKYDNIVKAINMLVSSDDDDFAGEDVMEFLPDNGN